MKQPTYKKGDRYQEFKHNVLFGCRPWYDEYINLKECGLPIPKALRAQRDAYLKNVAAIEKRYTYLGRMFLLSRMQVKRIVES